MAKESGTKALEDADIPYGEVEQAVVGYVYGDSTAGQRAVYGLGLTGIPVYNVNNNCSTGSTALFMAKQLHRGRAGRMRTGAGLREDGEGIAGREVHGPHKPDGQARKRYDPDAWLRGSPVAPQIRKRRARAHGEVRDETGVVRADWPEESLGTP